MLAGIGIGKLFCTSIVGCSQHVFVYFVRWPWEHVQTRTAITGVFSSHVRDVEYAASCCIQCINAQLMHTAKSFIDVKSFVRLQCCKFALPFLSTVTWLLEILFPDPEEFWWRKWATALHTSSLHLLQHLPCWSPSWIYLKSPGAQVSQVTWMDVLFGGFLVHCGNPGHQPVECYEIGCSFHGSGSFFFVMSRWGRWRWHGVEVGLSSYALLNVAVFG